MLKAITAFIAIIVLILALLLLDAAGRGQLRSDVEVTKLPASSSQDESKRTLTVYLPGLLADGVWSSRTFVETLQRSGDVWLVNSVGDRFRSDQVTSELAQRLEADQHVKIRFIGSSLGAHLALETIQKLSEQKRSDVDVSLVTVCSPSEGVSDLKLVLRVPSAVASVLRFGPVSNATFGPFVTRAVTGVQPRTFALTYYIDQVNYVRTRPAPDKAVLDQLKVVNMVAQNDELIRRTAVDAWATSTSSLVEVAGATHTSYDTDPEAWNRAFERALYLS